MNEPDLEALERRLRTLPPLLDVPPSLVAPSVRAAVADPDSPAPIRRAPRRSRRMVTPLVARGHRRHRRRRSGRGDHHHHIPVRRARRVSAHRDPHRRRQRLRLRRSWPPQRCRRTRRRVHQPSRPRARQPVLRNLVPDRRPTRTGRRLQRRLERQRRSPPHRPGQHEVGAMLDHPPIHRRPQHLHHRHARHPQPTIDLTTHRRPWPERTLPGGRMEVHEHP